MATTVFYAGTDRDKAVAFALFHGAKGRTVVEISATDRVQFFKEEVEQDPWLSGVGKDWIVMMASIDKIVVHGKPPAT